MMQIRLFSSHERKFLSFVGESTIGFCTNDSNQSDKYRPAHVAAKCHEIIWKMQISLSVSCEIRLVACMCACVAVMICS